MTRPRLIPILLIENGDLIKTTNFKNPVYLGDPINSIKIFNEYEVDELCIIDRSAYLQGINYTLLRQMAEEAFMPLSYGGGIKTIKEAKEIISIGFEKVVINTQSFNTINLIKELSNEIGSQSVVVSIDYKSGFNGKKNCFYQMGKKNSNIDPLSHALNSVKNGAGELLLTSINHEGKMNGFDYDFIKLIASSVDVPLIAHGGASSLNDISKVIYECGASAVAIGSLFVFMGPKKGILINYPETNTLIEKGIYKL
jgi:cyclase